MNEDVPFEEWMIPSMTDEELIQYMAALRGEAARRALESMPAELWAVFCAGRVTQLLKEVGGR